MTGTDKANELRERFPWFQPVWGIECQEGWYGLLESLCEAIQAASPPDQFKIIQVKEKFGGLRVYADGYTDEIRSLLYDAETDSFEVCELCGSKDGVKVGAKDGTRWVRALCEKCCAN